MKYKCISRVCFYETDIEGDMQDHLDNGIKEKTPYHCKMCDKNFCSFFVTARHFKSPNKHFKSTEFSNKEKISLKDYKIICTDLIAKSLTQSYETRENIFDIVVNEIEEIAKISHFSNGTKGILFEILCTLYLKHISNYTNIWLFREIPEEIRNNLGLNNQDYGIDIICQTHDNKFIAVQCKYSRKNKINWKILSTFYAMCLKTGPWEKYIVMTSAIDITRIGNIIDKEINICYDLWEKISFENWLNMIKKS